MKNILRSIRFTVGDQFRYENDVIEGEIQIRASKEKQDLIEENFRRFLDEAEQIIDLD